MSNDSSTWAKILEKDVIDEINFRTANPRNRLMLELMARGGMRIGEVLKLTPNDIEDRKAFIREPKSGKRAEVVFLPHKVSDRLQQYIREKGIGPDERIIPIAYGTARVIVKRPAKWWASGCGPTIFAAMPPPMRPAPALPWKSSAR